MSREIEFASFIDPDIYMDVDKLSNPFEMSIPVGISNTEAFTLWFKITITGSPSGWSNYTDELGSITAGNNDIFLWTFERGIPSLVAGENDEGRIVRILAYVDAGYTDLYASQDLGVTFHWFDSTDAAWTVLDLDNFDGGTTEGWAVETGKIDAGIAGEGQPTLNAGHFLSSPMGLLNGSWGTDKSNYKYYNTTGYSKARIVWNIYCGSGAWALRIDADLVVSGAIGALLGYNKWNRLAFSCPIKNCKVNYQASGSNQVYIDNIKIIVKA